MATMEVNHPTAHPLIRLRCTFCVSLFEAVKDMSVMLIQCIMLKLLVCLPLSVSRSTVGRIACREPNTLLFFSLTLFCTLPPSVSPSNQLLHKPSVCRAAPLSLLPRQRFRH